MEKLVKLKVEMLESPFSSPIRKSNTNGIVVYSEMECLKQFTTPQHIYITSDETIESGDCFIEGSKYASNGSNKPVFGRTNTKIVASSDKSMYSLKDCPVRTGISNVKYMTPNIPQDFLVKFILSFNLKEAIRNVVVVYESYEEEPGKILWRPKLSENNTLCIVDVKTEWETADVIELVRKAVTDLKGDRIGLSKWIKDNIPHIEK